ncbi:hypothetical protein F2P81_024994 [Scophthalmus maximus]|uniref:Uncharacterized protein n=1 Tax=Scophthalmus maximus TaxID=52904 RepID=A0A6A4RMD0_SCOMX|nr:hypothetical protein F2P81_024994 [Scophthalmus maximus]
MSKLSRQANQRAHHNRASFAFTGRSSDLYRPNLHKCRCPVRDFSSARVNYDSRSTRTKAASAPSLDIGFLFDARPPSFPPTLTELRPKHSSRKSYFVEIISVKSDVCRLRTALLQDDELRS